jgi:hypothetical protein
LPPSPFKLFRLISYVSCSPKPIAKQHVVPF